jgi:hypothetical protein
MFSDLEGTLLDGASLAEDASGDAVSLRGCDYGSVVISWSEATATDAVVKLQGSNDGSTWVDVASKTTTIGAASGTDAWELDHLHYANYRAAIVDNSESTGTVTARYYFKGKR